MWKVCKFVDILLRLYWCELVYILNKLHFNCKQYTNQWLWYSFRKYWLHVDQDNLFSHIWSLSLKWNQNHKLYIYLLFSRKQDMYCLLHNKLHSIRTVYQYRLHHNIFHSTSIEHYWDNLYNLLFFDQNYCILDQLDYTNVLKHCKMFLLNKSKVFLNKHC